jgi:hypothetical protein
VATEDKLTHDERLRLEALGQAAGVYGLQGAPPAAVIAAAREFERYVKDGSGGRGTG